MSTTNLSAGVSFTKKPKTSCYANRYKEFSSLQEAKTECVQDRNCSSVYDNQCDGIEWYLCPYGSISESSSGNSCTYVKEGKVRKCIE